MINADIVVIDSGVDITGLKGECDIVGGIFMYDNGKRIVVEEDEYKDRNGHGSGVTNMILMKAAKSSLFVIKIYEEGIKTSENVLNAALQYVLDNINCSLINISCGVVRCANINKMECICEKIQKRGITIISAFDNNGRMSYPAAFKSVIGIDCSFSCYKMSDFQISKGDVVDIRGMAYNLRIPSLKGSIIEDGGSSFVCGYITGLLWSEFKGKKIEKKDAMEFLEKKAKKSYGIPNVPEKSRLCIRKAILVPFTKEMHNLVRFADLLDFTIEGIYDLKYSGNVGCSVSKVIQEEIDYGYIIEDIEKIDWENERFDTIICGSLTKTNEALGKDIKKEILNKCRKYGKQIYMFDEDGYSVLEDLDAHEKYKSYVPIVTSDDNIFNQFGKLHEIGRPVLAIFGTSPKQGKYSLQLELRKRFLRDGYTVGQLGTEPSALLFGMDEIYNFGFNATVHIAGYNAVTYVNELMYKIERKYPDIIITGSQSQTVQYSSGNIGFYPIAQYEFLLGVQADTVLLCVTVGDDIDYVKRTVQFIQAINKCKILGLVVFPFKFRNVMGYLASHRYTVCEQEVSNYEKMLKKNFEDMEIFNISNEDVYESIYHSVLTRYSVNNK